MIKIASGKVLHGRLAIDPNGSYHLIFYFVFQKAVCDNIHIDLRCFHLRIKDKIGFTGPDHIGRLNGSYKKLCWKWLCRKGPTKTQKKDVLSAFIPETKIGVVKKAKHSSAFNISMNQLCGECFKLQHCVRFLYNVIASIHLPSYIWRWKKFNFPHH